MSSKISFACALAAATGLGTVGVVQAFPQGCTVTGEAYLDPIPDMTFPMNISSAELCQESCAELTACTHWSFWPDQDDCWLGGSGNRTLRAAQSDAISGPKVCEDPPVACTEAPAASFPSGNQAEDWPISGFQPKKLQCYPDDCTAVTTLESTEAGWPGKCKGLTEITITGDESCEANCLANPECPGFQVGENNTCWQGIGYDCSTDFLWDPSFQPSEAKRFMRGEVRLLKELVGIRLAGLHLVFNDTEITALGGYTEAKESCAKICYSILGCEYWQLSNATSGEGGGCWVDTVGGVAYPLLDTDLLAGSVDWIAGEYIQRYCPAGSSADEEAEEGGSSSMPVWLIVLLALLCLACIGAGLAYYFLFMSKKKKEKKKLPKKPVTENAAASPLMVTSQTPVQTAAYPLPAYQVVSPPLMVSTQQMPVAMAQPMQVVEVAPPVYTSTTVAPAVAAPAVATTSYTMAPAPAMAYATSSIVAPAPMAGYTSPAPFVDTTPAA